VDLEKIVIRSLGWGRRVAVSKQRRRSHILAPAVASLALVASACGGGGDDGPAAPAAAADGSQTVALKLIAFNPERLSVAAGTTVTWKNEDASEHTVTSGTVSQSAGGVTTAVDKQFESGSLKQNAVFSFTFTAPGTYSYFCQIHPATMRGEITVK
jgi:plastocyanin